MNAFRFCFERMGNILLFSAIIVYNHSHSLAHAFIIVESSVSTRWISRPPDLLRLAM